MRTICSVLLLTSVITSPARALEIYLDTNSPPEISRGSELFDVDSWKETAAALDGIWFVAQGMTKPPAGHSVGKARDQFIEAHRHLKWIVEVSQHAVDKRAATDSKSAIYEPGHLVKAGIKRFEVMSYFSGRPFSTLTEAEIEDERKVMDNIGEKDAPLIVNTRGYTKNHALHKLLETEKIQGFSFEVPCELLVRGGFLESELVPAIRDAVKHKKIIYVLLNADKSKEFPRDVQAITEKLMHACRAEMASPLVRFAIGNYEKHGVAFTPERGKDGKLANTTTGAALWLTDFADKNGYAPDDEMGGLDIRETSKRMHTAEASSLVRVPFDLSFIDWGGYRKWDQAKAAGKA